MRLRTCLLLRLGVGRGRGRQYTCGPLEPSNGSLEDPLAEALRLIALADSAGLRVRLMGGLAFHARAPEWTARIERARRDIDLATASSDRRGLTELLVGSGYDADKEFNALHGHKQLYFVDPRRDRPVDVLVDRLEMCHTFDFGERLVIDSPTLPLADLLLSKLQVVRINRKDVLDALVLLGEYPLTENDSGISVPRVVSHTSEDWGWWRTVGENLAKLAVYAQAELGPEDLAMSGGRPLHHDPAAQAMTLRERIDAAPKSTRWKLRSRVGDRVQWYQLPEEVGHE